MKRNDLYIIVFVLICFISFLMIRNFSLKAHKYLIDYGISKSNNIISIMINDVISEIDKNEIIVIEKNDNDEIVNLNIDNYVVNNNLRLINSKILEEINKLENVSNHKNIFYVPYNVIFGNNSIVNLSPRIPFKIEFLGNLDNSSFVDVREYGINSYIVEVVVNVSIELQIIIPFVSENYKIDKKIILESKIIHGEIPKYYGS
jgi:sporulation protein YunB